MRFGVFITVAALTAGLAGCASMNPKNWQWPAFGQKKAKEGRDRDPAVPADNYPAPAAPPLAHAQPAGPYNGVLAGQVIDAFNNKRPAAQIQVTPLDAAPNDAPLEAAANDHGYFTIQGLQPGRRYQLTARARRGEQQLAGTTLATPPNAVLLIRVSEDLAGSNLGTARPDGKERRSTEKDSAPSATPYRNDGSQGWAPNAAPNYSRPSERGTASLLAPTPIDRSATDAPANRRDIYIESPPRNWQETPSNNAPPPLRPQYQTYGDNLAQTNPDAIMSIPGPAPSGRRSTIGVPLGEPRSPPQFIGESAAPLAVPSCLVRGNRLENFALYDVQGRPFELGEASGRLVLLDFWGTWCTPCVQALPHLADLQRRYGPHGLEVIGIAYEEGSPEERAERVNFVRHRQGINYRMLLGEGEDCPVRTKLGISNFPTLILVDPQGQIVWRGEGLSSQNKARLEAEIRRRLPGTALSQSR